MSWLSRFQRLRGSKSLGTTFKAIRGFKEVLGFWTSGFIWLGMKNFGFQPLRDRSLTDFAPSSLALEWGSETLKH